MVDKEMLSAISGLLDEKLEGVKVEVEGVKAEVEGVKAEVEGIKADLKYVKVVQLENNVIPRLNTIEECYIDTSKRYLERTEQIDVMRSDIDVLQNVVMDHSKKLNDITA